MTNLLFEKINFSESVSELPSSEEFEKLINSILDNTYTHKSDNVSKLSVDEKEKDSLLF